MSKSQSIIAMLSSMVLLSSAACEKKPEQEARSLETVAAKPAPKVDPDVDFASQLEDVKAGKSALIQLQTYRPLPDDLRALVSVAGRLRTLQLDAGLSKPEDLFLLPADPALVHLRIRESTIDDQALQHLTRAFPNLQILNLPHLAVTSASNDVLQPMQKLSSLRIGGDRIDGAFLNQLQALPHLQHLHLIGPDLRDEDLQLIASFQMLRSFYLDDCQLSNNAWEQFFANRNNVHVHLDQFHHDRDPRQH